MIRAIVTDIEGTTSSISFVHEVLFPYAREHLAEFVRVHQHEPAVAGQLREVGHEVGAELDTEAAIAQLLAWIAEDKKITPLKALQGLIWESGYKNGDFTGHVYADAVRGLRHWHQAGIKLYVYSSGSVHAQQLLFGYSNKGDLTPLFSGYFDTRIGNKREVTSYRAIVEELGVDATGILFLSDIKEELDAAQSAGMQTCWLVRDGATLDLSAAHPQVTNFDAITLK
jgi:enolase-phosphatase E1